MIRGSTIFVTGGTGFVGSHLVERLLESGAASVRCLVRSDPKWLSGLNVDLIRGDLSEGGFPGDSLSGVDYVFHVAAMTRARTREAFQDANVDGTIRLLDRVIEEAPGVRRVVLTSSLAVVGRGAEVGTVAGSSTMTDGTAASGSAAAPRRAPLVADEDTPLDPVSMYGMSKAQMERAAGLYAERLPITIIRPPAVYGPRESDILTFFRTVSRGICPIVGSATDPRMSLVHVRDLVAGMIQAAESPAATGKTYFLGGDEPLSWGQIRDAAARNVDRSVYTVQIPPLLVPAVGAGSEAWGLITGKYPPLNREKAREIVEACTACDSSRAVQDFGYTPSTDLEEGFRETIEWYREHGWLK